jgi:hypothetical protein
MKNNARVNLKINEPEGGKRYEGASEPETVSKHDDLDSVLADLKEM